MCSVRYNGVEAGSSNDALARSRFQMRRCGESYQRLEERPQLHSGEDGDHCSREALGEGRRKIRDVASLF